LAIKTVAHSQPCRDTLSQELFKLSQFGDFFSESRSFSPDFGGSSRLLAIFRPKNITGCNCGCNCTLWALEQSLNLIFSKKKFNFKK
jgi:hypothetical protein